MSEELYNKLKNTLRINGFKEQLGGQAFISGSYGTSFIKDDEVIMIGFDPNPDKQFVKENFRSETDLLRYPKQDINKYKTIEELTQLFRLWSKHMDILYQKEDRHDASFWEENPANWMFEYNNNLFLLWIEHDAGINIQHKLTMYINTLNKQE